MIMYDANSIKAPLPTYTYYTYTYTDLYLL